MKRNGTLVALCLVLGPTAPAAAPNVIDIADRLELFVDAFLIDTVKGVTRRLHAPQRREVAIKFDKPWEGGACGYPTVFQDDGVYRMYYRAQDVVGPYIRFPNMYGPEVTCTAQSKDGIHWTRPKLNLFVGEFTSRYGKKFTVGRDNNIVWIGKGRLVDTTHNFSPFRDTNPACKPEARYKAFARMFDGKVAGLLAFQSPDAIHWSLMQDAPVTTEGRNDTHPAVFWDSVRKRYVEFHRGNMRRGYRDLITSTSEDFLHWTPDQEVTYGNTPNEHLYSPKVVPYFRAPHIYLAFPMRLVTGRVWVKQHPEHEISDAVFMSSRDGVRFDRSYMEGWIRPGLDPERKSWIHGNTEPACGLLQTGPDELSVYWIECAAQVGSIAQMRRGTLRLDGFVSMHATYAGGEFVTKPLRFAGRRLVINFATSAAGAVRVEIQDPTGKPLPGFELKQSLLTYGDAIEQEVRWKSGPDVAPLAGKPIRLRFVMKDADLYAIRFR